MYEKFAGNEGICVSVMLFREREGKENVGTYLPIKRARPPYIRGYVCNLFSVSIE